jgi:hypothetical protein
MVYFCTQGTCAYQFYDLTGVFWKDLVDLATIQVSCAVVPSSKIHIICVRVLNAFYICAAF